MKWYRKATVQAAIVTGVFVVLAAGIALLKRKPSPISTIDHTALHNGSIVIQGDARNITLNYSRTDTELEKVINTLEGRIQGHDNELIVTKQELVLITKALRELETKTSAIEVLPDGRARFGMVVAGDPRVTRELHDQAVTNFLAGHYAEALKYSRTAILSYERTREKGTLYGTGFMDTNDIAKLYYLGTLSAVNLKDYDLARMWITDAIHHSSQQQYVSVLRAIDNK